MTDLKPDEMCGWCGKMRPLTTCRGCFQEQRSRLKAGMPRDLANWVISRWDEEVANRPTENVYRRTLDNTWRQVYRHVTDGEELPRPVHGAEGEDR